MERQPLCVCDTTGGADGIAYTISSPFGYRSDPTTGKNTLHKGVDFAAAYGTPIYAGESGKVIFADFGVTGGGYGGYGNVVAIQHSSSTMSLYGHCSQLLVKKGEAVPKGQVIALVGSTYWKLLSF